MAADEQTSRPLDDIPGLAPAAATEPLPSIDGLARALSCDRRFYTDWRAEKDGRDASPKNERCDMPVPGWTVTADLTTEALGPILTSNPRGLIATPD